MSPKVLGQAEVGETVPGLRMLKKDQREGISPGLQFWNGEFNMLLRHPVEMWPGLGQEERERRKSEIPWYRDNTSGIVWGENKD